MRVQRLLCLLMRCLNRTTRRQRAVKRFDIQRRAGRHYAGAHGDNRLNAALEQLDSHAAENVLLSDRGALAGVEYRYLHATVAQHRRQRSRVYRVSLAVIFFKVEPTSLLIVAAFAARRLMKYPVTIKMQDVNRAFFIVQPRDEFVHGGRTKKL